jgi:hypothetical protein
LVVPVATLAAGLIWTWAAWRGERSVARRETQRDASAAS